MKSLFLFMIIGIITNSWNVCAESDLAQKISSLDEEISKAKEMVATGENPEAYQTFLKDLQAERERYVKLSKAKQPSSTNLAKDPSVQKTLPKSVVKKVDAQKAATQEALPLHQQHDITQREISNTRGLLINLKAQKNPSEATQKFIQSEEVKLAELEKQKLDYEIALSEKEDAELKDFKKESLRVGAMFDFYYMYDFNRFKNTDATTGNNDPLPARNYNRRSNEFTVNLIELNVMKSFKNLDIYADLDFGDFANQNIEHDADPTTYNIGQAFLRYAIPNLDGVTVTAGKFYSHVGLEVAKSKDNRNYSRPYSFHKGIPFWHEGVSVYKSGLGPFGVGLYVLDRTDAAKDNNSGKTYGAQISFVQDSVTSYFNFISGAETPDEGNMRTIYEWNILVNATKDLSLLFDITYGTEKNGGDATHDTGWLGLVGYIDYNLFARDYLCLRVENFKDLTNKAAANNLFSAINGNDPANIMSYTLTNRYDLKNGSEVRLEWRTDKADQDMYPDKDGKFTDKQDTLTLAWLYAI